MPCYEPTSRPIKDSESSRHPETVLVDGSVRVTCPLVKQLRAFRDAPRRLPRRDRSARRQLPCRPPAPQGADQVDAGGHLADAEVDGVALVDESGVLGGDHFKVGRDAGLVAVAG